MHIVKDENGNVCAHGHHEHTHTHTYEHTHEHSHMEGHENEHEHSHEDGGHCHGHGEGHCHDHGEGHCHGNGEGHCHNHGEGHCHSHGEGCHEDAPANRSEALLKYMLDHNTHHASELDQMAAKLASEGQEKAAEQIRKAVDEFQKGNLYLGLALSLVKES